MNEFNVIISNCSKRELCKKYRNAISQMINFGESLKMITMKSNMTFEYIFVQLIIISIKMTEEEDQNSTKIPGVVYGYIESVEAALPEGNEVVVELVFHQEGHDLVTKREGNLFIVNRRVRFPVNIEPNEEMTEMQEKYIVLKLYRITNDEQKRQFGDLKINLQHLLKPQTMEVKTEDARAKMSNKPQITYSFGVYLKSDPVPSEMSGFTYEKRHLNSNPKQPEPSNTQLNSKSQNSSRVLLLVDDTDGDPEHETSYSLFNSTYQDSSDSFDEDITAHAIQLASQSSDSSEISEFIVRTWFDLNKSKIGYPGYQLSKRVVDKKGNVISNNNINQIFSMLEDIRTTTKNEDSAISFFASTLSFSQNVRKYPELKDKAEQLCMLAMDTAASIVCPILKKYFLDTLKYEVGSVEFNEAVNSLRSDFHKKYFTNSSSKYLGEFILDQLDCLLANSIITEKMFTTFGQIVNANSAVSEYETALKIPFNRFRQVILSVIAHENILANPSICKVLVPLVSPTYIYFLYCIIKPDETMPNALDYKQIESFAKQMKVNFQANISQIIVFKPDKKPLPVSCSEFLPK